MIEDKKITKYLEKHEIELLVKYSVKLTIQNRLQFFLMLDAGLRVSEVIDLKYSNFDFRSRLLKLKSLKKRGKDVSRTIPLSRRLFLVLSDFISERPPGKDLNK